MLRFFEARHVPVAKEETMQIMALIEWAVRNGMRRINGWPWT